jgi:hypothetical protein
MADQQSRQGWLSQQGRLARQELQMPRPWSARTMHRWVWYKFAQGLVQQQNKQ